MHLVHILFIPGVHFVKCRCPACYTISWQTFSISLAIFNTSLLYQFAKQCEYLFFARLLIYIAPLPPPVHLVGNMQWIWAALNCLTLWFCICISISATFLFLTLKSNPKDLWLLSHLIRLMRRHDIYDICEYLWIFLIICEYLCYLWYFWYLWIFVVNIYEYLWIFVNFYES